MTCALRLTRWWMNFATLLAHWMLRCGQRVSRVDFRPPVVRVLSSSGSIVRSSPAVTRSLWPPLVFRLTNTEKPSITWLLLQSTNATWDLPGVIGEESGEERLMWFTLSFQEPHSGQNSEG